MDTVRLLIADGSDDFGMELADALRGTYHVRTCRKGQEALELMRTYLPDILVLDLMLPGLDGISLLQAAADSNMYPMVLATTRFVSSYVLDAVEKLGVGYLMIKPCDIMATVSRIGDLTQRMHTPMVAQPDLRTAVSNLLLSLNVPTKLKGYGFLREAIIAMSRDTAQSITKELYPAVAAKCGGTAAQVERSIRSAIQAAWMNRDEQAWRLYFQTGIDGHIPRPTNASFITRLADELTWEREQEFEELIG